MQLAITSPQMEKPLATIEWNHEEIKKDLSVALKKYRGVTLTEETYREGKQEVANLRKLKTALDDKRKQVKNYYMEPISAFEAKMKDLTAMIDEPIEAINTQVKAFDDARKQAKRQSALDYFNAKIEQSELPESVTFESIELPMFSQLSTSDKQMQEEIDRQIKELIDGLDAITASKSEWEVEMKDKFLATHSLPDALKEGQRLDEVKARKLQLEAERKKAPADDFTNMPVLAEKENPRPQKTTEGTELHTLRFAVTGSQEQLIALSKYMTASGLKFEALKQGG